MNDTTVENVIKPEFGKRFKDPTPPITTKMPVWIVRYELDNNAITEDLVEGYISSLMPFLMIADSEDKGSINSTVFCIPCERLRNLSRVKTES